jgi:hypothetical protein
MASQIGQNYLALILEQANQAGKPAPVRQPSMGGRDGSGFQQVQDFGGQGVVQLNGGGQPAGGGGQMPMPPMGGDLQSLDAKMALARANARPANSFGGVSARTRAPAEAMKAERAYRENMYQRHVESTKAAVKLFTPIMGKEQAQRFGDMVIENPKLLEKSLDEFFSATSPTTLQKQVEYVNALEQGSPERDLAEKILFKNNGVSLNVGADGSIQLATGGEMPVQTAANSTQQNMIYKSQDDIAKSLMMVHSIANDFEEDFLRPISQLKGAFGRFADKWNIPDKYVDRITGEPDMKRWGAEQEAFARKSARRVFAHRKALTGVAGGEKEMEKIEASLANAMLDSPLTFKINLESELNDTYDEFNLRRIQAGLPPYDFSGAEYRLFPDVYEDTPQPETVTAEPAPEPKPEIDTDFPDISSITDR